MFVPANSTSDVLARSTPSDSAKVGETEKAVNKKIQHVHKLERSVSLLYCCVFNK